MIDTRLAIEVARWVCVAILAVGVVAAASYCYAVFRVRSHIAHAIGGIPFGTAERLWEIQKNRTGVQGRVQHPRLGPGAFLAIVASAALAAGAIAWILRSPIFLLASLGLFLTALGHLIFSTTPPAVVFLSDSTYEAVMSQSRIRSALRPLGEYRVVSFMDPSVLKPTQERTPGWVWDELRDMSFRMREVPDDDWYSALRWLVGLVPIIVIKPGLSDETLREIEMVFDRGLTVKAFFLVDEKCEVPYIQMYKRRLKAETARFMNEEEMLEALQFAFEHSGPPGFFRRMIRGVRHQITRRAG